MDFWTYSCVNCIRTLPYLKAWYARYHRDGLVIVGVHTPEFAFEHVIGNVERAVREHGIDYPVAVDNDYGDVGCVGQPVLAGRLPDRPLRRRARGALRRGRLRPDPGRHPPAPGRARQRADGARARCDHALGQRRRLPRPTWAPTAPPPTPSTCIRAAFTTTAPRGRSQPTPSSWPAGGTSRATRSWRGRARTCCSGTSLRASTWWPRHPPRGRRRSGSRSTAPSQPPVRVPDDDLYQLAHMSSAGPHLLDLTVPAGTTLYSFTFG